MQAGFDLLVTFQYEGLAFFVESEGYQPNHLR